MGDRARDHALFGRVKKAVLGRAAIAPGTFDHLRGRLVTVNFFDDDSSPARPIRQRDVPKLVQALATFRPPVEESGPLPDQADPNSVARFDGGELSSEPFPRPPDTTFFRLTSFELAFSTPTWVRQPDAWQLLLDRLHDNHDQPGVDILAVVAGSPTQNNVAYPADAVLMRAVVERAEATTVRTNHIGRIWLHSWLERAVYELIPGELGTRRLCG